MIRFQIIERGGANLHKPLIVGPWKGAQARRVANVQKLLLEVILCWSAYHSKTS
jgi:hypothetical protein